MSYILCAMSRFRSLDVMSNSSLIMPGVLSPLLAVSHGHERTQDPRHCEGGPTAGWIQSRDT